MAWHRDYSKKAVISTATAVDSFSSDSLGLLGCASCSAQLLRWRTVLRIRFGRLKAVLRGEASRQNMGSSSQGTQHAITFRMVSWGHHALVRDCVHYLATQIAQQNMPTVMPSRRARCRVSTQAATPLAELPRRVLCKTATVHTMYAFFPMRASVLVGNRSSGSWLFERDVSVSGFWLRFQLRRQQRWWR
jgi:hypothetical protein